MMVQLRVAGRQPRGWETMVARLQSLDNVQDLQQHMLEMQCHIVAGELGLLWQIQEQGVLPLARWPVNVEVESEGPQHGLMVAMRQAAQAVQQRGQSQVLTMRDPGSDQDGSLYLFATVMRRGGQPAAISTVVATCQDPEVITATAAAREMAAGLYDSHETRLAGLEQQRAAAHMREAMAVLAVMQEAEGFTGAALNLVNELARVLGCQSVSLGWIYGSQVKLQAVSDADHVRRHTDQAARLEIAMAECLDQEQPILWPVAQDAEPMLAQAVTFSHRQLTGGREGGQVLSVPLRDRDRLVGVLTLEADGMLFDAARIGRLQMIADVVAPQLADRRESDRWLIGHAWQVVRRRAAWVVGPQHVAWKLLGIAVLVGLIYFLLASWPYSLSAPFVFEAHERRTVSVMEEGRLEQVLVQPGDFVQAGQLLAVLDTRELQLQRLETLSLRRETEIQRDQARSEGKQSEVARLEARMGQVDARLGLLQTRLDNARIHSARDGVVLAGYWHDKIGRVVEKGTAMFEVAPLEPLTAVLRVGENDFNELAQLLDDRQTPVRGELTTRAEPGRSFPITFERMVPMATADDGVNAFEVWCTLDEPAPWLRPGMEGKARLEVGRRPLRWIVSHRLLDSLRLWLWW